MINFGEPTGEKEAPLPSSALAYSLRGGMASSGKAGNSFKVAAQPPTPTFEVVNGFAYLRDLKVNSFSGRDIQLDATPPYSSQTTVVASYRPADAGETNNNPGAGDGHYISTPLRDFRCQISFGTGSAQCYVECDVSEGMAMSLPCQSLTLAIYSTFFQREIPGQGGFNRQTELNCQAHLASGVATMPGQCTTRVFAPYQAALDLSNPPTIDKWLSDLETALCQRSYLMTQVVEEPPV